MARRFPCTSARRGRRGGARGPEREGRPERDTRPAEVLNTDFSLPEESRDSLSLWVGARSIHATPSRGSSNIVVT